MSDSNLITRFLFAPVDRRTMVAFRIMLAMMLAWRFWPRGEKPVHFLYAHPDIIELYDSIVLTTPYMIVVGLFIGLFMIGWKSRISGLLLCALLFPLDFLDEGRQSGQILIFTLFCTSLMRFDRKRDGSRRENCGPMWPVRLIQAQVCVVYGINAIYKSTPEFMDGTVLMKWSETTSFTTVIPETGLPMGPLLLSPWMLGTGTVLIEYLLAIGLWVPRLRWFVALTGIIFHLGIAMVMEIFMLDWASMFLYLAFLLPFEKRLSPNPDQR